VQSVTEGLGVLATGRSVLAVLGTSVIAWLISGVQFYWVARAVGLRLPWSAPFLMVCLTSLGMVVPASPGSLGVIESITVLTLGLFRVDRETAVGYALVLRALSYVTLAGLGLYSLWQEGLDLAGLRKIAAQPPSGLENTSAG
jgi:hypothetical protein